VAESEFSVQRCLWENTAVDVGMTSTQTHALLTDKVQCKTHTHTHTQKVQKIQKMWSSCVFRVGSIKPRCKTTARECEQMDI